MIHPPTNMGPRSPTRPCNAPLPAPMPGGSVSGRDRFGRRPQPQERRLGAGPGPVPSPPDLAPPPRAPPGARVPSRRRRARSLADVTPRAEVTFSRGWTRRSVAGRGRACRFFSGDIHIIFVTGVGRGRGVPGARASSRPGTAHRSRAPARAGRHAAENPPESRRRSRRAPGAAAAASRGGPRTGQRPRGPASGQVSEPSRRDGRRAGRAPGGCVGAGAAVPGGGASSPGAGPREEGPSVSPAAAERRPGAGEGDRGPDSRARAEPPEGVRLRLDRCPAGGAPVPERSDRCRLSAAGLEARRRRAISRPRQTGRGKILQKQHKKPSVWRRACLQGRFVVRRWPCGCLSWSPGMQQLERFSCGRAAASEPPPGGPGLRGRRWAEGAGWVLGSLVPGRRAEVLCRALLCQCSAFLGAQSHRGDRWDRKLFRGTAVWTQV